MGKPISRDMILSGRIFSIKEIKEIEGTASALRNLSRKEMALTICEHLPWYQPNGKYKVNSTLKALEKLERLGYISLPDVRKWSRHKDREIVFTTRGKKHYDIQGSVEQWEPIIIEPVKDKEDALLWKIRRAIPLSWLQAALWRLPQVFYCLKAWKRFSIRLPALCRIFMVA